MKSIPTILIINNDKKLLQRLQSSFEAAGYKVEATTNSVMGLQLFFQHKPVAVILDIFMDDKDGFEVTKEIRNFCQKTLIVAISAYERYFRAITRLGANLALPAFANTESILDAVTDAVEAA